jgi:hypothetical protein
LGWSLVSPRRYGAKSNQARSHVFAAFGGRIPLARRKSSVDRLWTSGGFPRGCLCHERR